MIKEYLTRDLNFNKLHNAYLVSTDDIAAALAEIADFLSDNFYQQQKNHPDFMLVQKMEGNVKNISIEQTRNLQRFLNKTSVLSGRKSAIIYGADQMNVNAANSCLKILEDTPKNTHIFLITANPAMILPTIRSRCSKIKHNFLLEDDNTILGQIDDYYIRPLLKTTSIEEHLIYLKEFGSKDRDLWVEFTTNVQSLFVRIAKKLTAQEMLLSPLETKFLEQMMPISANKVTQKYDKLVKLTEDTIIFDLDLRTSYLLLTRI